MGPLFDWGKKKAGVEGASAVTYGLPNHIPDSSLARMMEV